jgi:hypothetical protein
MRRRWNHYVALGPRALGLPLKIYGLDVNVGHSLRL